MSLATTTLSSAVGVNDNSIVVASATSVAAGRLLIIDGEWMQVCQNYSSGTTVPVLRGRDGSVTAAHVSSANVVHGNAADFSVPPPGAFTTKPPSRVRKTMSYVASGAITLPTAGEDMLAILIGTSALTMTVAAPTKDMDGCRLQIQGNAKSASTIQFDGTVGIGNAGSSYDIITLQNAGDVGLSVTAINGFWNIDSAPAITGTTTAIGSAIA